MVALEPAVAAGLLVAIESGWGYRFRRPLIQESIYAGTGQVERARLHARIAGAIETVGGADTPARRAQLAHHYLAAGPLGDLAKAISYARATADAAMRQGAWADAIRHLEQALSTGGPGCGYRSSQGAGMPLITTELFRTLTPASPTAVWTELTRAGSAVPFLYGMTVDTDWHPGSPLSMRSPFGAVLVGRVLRADPARWLAYTLGDRLDEPSTYVTWNLAEDAAGTIVRLYVDEPFSIDDDLERVWLPVLRALAAALERGDHAAR
jgi:hypothetical protein